jgi:general secretion pathway protein D
MQIKRPGRISIIFFLILPLYFFSLAQAAPEEAAEKSRRFITIDFENVDINLFIKYISELTGINFIVDKTVKGNVTIISPTKISEDEAYRVFLSVLDVHGFTTVEAGAVTKILPAVKARSENIRTFTSDVAQHPEDKIVTQLIPLKHTSPDEIKKILAPLVSKTSVMIAHTQSGILIVTETLSNIQRLIAIIEAIDVAYTGEDIAVLPLEFASSTTVGKVLSSLFQQARATPQGARAEKTSIKIVPYERINALIVVATPSDIERVNRLVKVLDSEMKKDSGNIHVHYLQHAGAEEMAKVLNFLPAQSAGQEGAAAPGTAPAISREVKIMADVETNALIINASRNEYNVLADVIAKLDIPRRMVYLEALILEVNTTKNFEVGVEWALGGKFSDDTGTLASGFSSTPPFGLLGNIGEASPPSATGLTFGLIKQGIKIGGVTFPNIGAVLRAYKNDSDIHIVSTPQILTTDNKKAEISVGENVPYITSRNVSASEQDYTNYEYRDVSTKLTITPHINQAETLRLEIATEVIKLQNADNDTPTTFKRTADTTVIVKNNETVVIGGIIGQDSTKSNTRVPLLGDIPILGWLFRSDTNTDTRTNMFIFITPRIIKNPADLTSVTMRKEEQMGEVMPEVKKELFREVNVTHAFRLAELGFEKMRAGLNSEAKTYFDEALAIDPNNPYALYNLGVINEEEGNHLEASRNYRKVILTGTSMTAVDATDPSKIGAPLIQLARERLEEMQRVETPKDTLFEENQGR